MATRTVLVSIEFVSLSDPNTNSEIHLNIAIILESGIDNIGKFATSLRNKDAQQSTKFAIPLACVWTADIVDAIGVSVLS